MEQTHDNNWELSLEQIAQRFEYPPTPDIATAVQSRIGRQPQAAGREPVVFRGRLAWAILLVVLFAAVTLAAPRTRAAVLSLFARIGAIDIFIDDAAPTPLPATAPRPTAAPTAVPEPAAAPNALALHELGEPVELAKAQDQAGFDLVIPAVLGDPDEIYTHRNVDLPAATLVWRSDDGTILSLTEIGVGAFAQKMVGEANVRYIMIGDNPAVWLEGPHRLLLFGDGGRGSLLIDSNVLIWADRGVTYRLEGELSEAEMAAIARSLLVVGTDP